MKRVVGWILVAVVTLSLLAAPVASAQVGRDDVADSSLSWVDALFGWLTAVVSGDSFSGEGTGTNSPNGDEGDTGPTVDPNG